MRVLSRRLLTLLCLLAIAGALCHADEVAPLPRVAATPPADVARTFRVMDDFELQLLAAEPLVTDPVDMQYDEWGRAYVVEMCDYPYTDKASDKPFVERTRDAPLGKVRRLEDRDGDGRFDHSVVFAEDLSWPTGIALWKGGVFVVATPELWWLNDTDDDGKADERKVIHTGFRKFNVQAVVNNLEWGLDHWLYAAGSSNGGQIRRGDDPQGKPTLLPTADFRFSPADPKGVIELLSGGARFGNCFNDAGDRFICNIRNPVQHIALPRRHLQRNPDAPLRSGVVDVAESGDQIAVYRASPPEPWRVINSRRLAFDATLASPRSESVAEGYMTSACGLTIYRGDAYPDSYRGSVFLAEPSANLIHHQHMERRGATFLSKRSLERKELVASSDNWFRPVNMAHAPDGTLTVLDMYRETIEHPWSIPDDIKARLDLESGRDRGRIYRLAPKGFVPRPAPRLGDLSSAELVPLLAHRNAWHRDTAHRLIFERQDASTIEPLRGMMRTSESPLGRLHALWSLAGLQALSDDDLAEATRDGWYAVRRAALELAEPRLASSTSLRDVLIAAAADSDVAVRLQAAFSLGVWPATSDASVVAAAMAKIAARDPDDELVRAAVWSSLGKSPVPFVVAYGANRTADARDAALLTELGTIAGKHIAVSRIAESDRDALWQACEKFDDPSLSAWTTGLGEGMARQGQSLEQLIANATQPGAVRIKRILESSLTIVVDPQQSEVERRRAMSLAVFLEPSRAREALSSLLAAGVPAELATQAVRTLGKFDHESIPASLVSAYPRLRPDARREVVEALLSRPAWHATLVESLQQRAIAVNDVPHARRNVLVRSGDPAIKGPAIKLFAEALEQRKAVYERYRQAIAIAVPERSRGEGVFRRECVSCHKLNNEGRDIGPNLATIRNRAADEVLLHVLDPNRDVPPNFVAFTLVTKAGRVISGMIQSEDSSRVALLLANGEREEIARDDIDELSPTNQSLMPVGFETRITPAEMADLIAYLLK